MTCKEFSDEFDVLYNSITSNQAPGLDSYEKSVFLTKAQREILKAYFDPRGNKFQEGFDDSQERQIDFSKSIVLSKYEEEDLSGALFDSRPNSKSSSFPEDALIILNERVHVSKNAGGNKDLVVVPLKYTEYDRLMSKPYKRPLQNQAWRIITGVGTKVDLVVGPQDTITEYDIRYIKRPLPIIVEPLEGVTIDGYYGAIDDGSPTNKMGEAEFPLECELDPGLHPEILQRAVELAKAVYIGDLNSQIALGQTSQTNIGVVQQASR